MDHLTRSHLTPTRQFKQLVRNNIQGEVEKTLVVSDLVESTALVSELGDGAAADLFIRHDHEARRLVEEYGGIEIDKSDGFLILFDQPIRAVRFALAYHELLKELSKKTSQEIAARVGIHLGNVIMRKNRPAEIARGAKPIEVDGIAKVLAARLMALGEARQTLLTRNAFEAARSTVGTVLFTRRLRWFSHGFYDLAGVPEPVEVFEVGVQGLSPMSAPRDRQKARQVVKSSSFGWEESIAVLPFRNIGHDASQEFFCDGITEQLITTMHMIPELKVIGRTSVMAYKDTEKDARRIGAELKVNNLLSGSIMKSNDKIRLTAELANAADGFVVWSKTYDRTMSDIFTVQDDLANEIVAALKVEFPSRNADTVRRMQTQSIEAYELAMRSMYHTNNYYFTLQESEFHLAVNAGNKAVEIEPKYAMALVSLSYVYALRYFLTRFPRDLELCEGYASKLNQVCPGDPSTLMSLGGVADLKGQKWEAISCFSRSITLNPNSSLAVHLLGRSIGYGLGLYEVAVGCYTKTIELDPLYVFAYHNRAKARIILGDYHSAICDLEKSLLIRADDHHALRSYIEVSIMIGERESAESLIATLEEIKPDACEEYRALLQALRGDRRAVSLHMDAKVAALLGMKDEAFDMIELSVSNNDLSAYWDLRNNPLYDPLRDDSRFVEILASEEVKHQRILQRCNEFIDAVPQAHQWMLSPDDAPSGF